MVTEVIVLQNSPCTDGIKMRRNKGEVDAGRVAGVSPVDVSRSSSVYIEEVVVCEKSKEFVAEAACVPAAPGNIVAIKIIS